MVSVPDGLFLGTLIEEASTQVGTFQVAMCLKADQAREGES